MSDFIYNYPLMRYLLNKNSSKLFNLEFIWKELADRVISRLDYIKIQPNAILDCGSGLGYDYKLLREKYPDVVIYELDSCVQILKSQYISQSWINKILSRNKNRLLINGEVYHLPLKNQSVDFVYANQLLPYLSDLLSYFKEMRRVLRIGGGFLFSGLGVDSFKEIRELGLSTFRFPDMHDIGDMLIEVGFSNPVVDTEYITLEYDSLTMLLNDIKIIGHGAANSSELISKINREDYKQLQARLDKPIKLTLEIFVAHGWKDRNKIDLPDGHSVINFKR